MILYNLARGLFKTIFILMGWRIVGVKNIPSTGPVILVANHISLWDPILVGCGIERPVAYMAKDELFSIPLLGSIIRRLGAFPVKRGKGDLSAIRQSLEVLKKNKVLGLFPEGTRSRTGKLQKALPGMVLIMDKSKAPIVPIKVVGTQKLFSKGWGKVGMVIGEPIYPDQFIAPEETENKREWLAQQVMNLIENLPDKL